MTVAAISIPSSSQAALRLWLEFGFERLAAFSVQDDLGRVDSKEEAAADTDDFADVELARGGDGDAFERIVRRHQQEIAWRLRRFTRDPLILEELVHETFVQAYVGLHKYRGDAPLIHWLHRIAVRAGYRFWKSRRSQRAAVSLNGNEPATPRARDADDGTLERVMGELGARDRLVLTLLYLEGHSVAETANLTEWSRTMVKVQAYRARAKLRTLMVREMNGGRA